MKVSQWWMVLKNIFLIFKIWSLCFLLYAFIQLRLIKLINFIYFLIKIVKLNLINLFLGIISIWFICQNISESYKWLPERLWWSLTISWGFRPTIFLIYTTYMTLLRNVLNLLQNNILGILQLLNLSLNLANSLENLSDIHFSKSYIFKDFINLLTANFTVLLFIY